MQEALERLMVGRTVIVIAHRLSTIQSADSIAVLHEGRIGEQGTYKELSEKEGGIFKKQLESSLHRGAGPVTQATPGEDALPNVGGVAISLT